MLSPGISRKKRFLANVMFTRELRDRVAQRRYFQRVGLGICIVDSKGQVDSTQNTVLCQTNGTFHSSCFLVVVGS